MCLFIKHASIYNELINYWSIWQCLWSSMTDNIMGFYFLKHNWQNDEAIMNFEKVMKWLYNCCNYISVLWKVSPSANKTGVWLPSDFLLLFCRIVCTCKTNIYICLENLNSWTLNVGISFSFLFYLFLSLIKWNWTHGGISMSGTLSFLSVLQYKLVTKLC